MVTIWKYTAPGKIVNVILFFIVTMLARKKHPVETGRNF